MDFLSFRMHNEFFDNYQTRTPKWGFPMGAGNTLGEHSWITKYARRKEDGTKERYWEGLRRVIEGMYSIQKDHALQYKLPWSEDTAHRSAQEAYERAFAGKWSPPGRGLWVMGTELVNGKHDSSPLQNCAFISTEHLADDPVLPFTRLMDMSMLGVGVGFDTKGAGKVTLHDPTGVYPHQVADSREGWVESVGCLLRAYFTSSRLPHFDYSKIRPAGAPIKTFGGVAAGPVPLQRCHQYLVGLLRDRGDEVLESTDIVDIMNLIGKCVVSGNVRRSAEIALGDPGDERFLDLKDWNKFPLRMGPDGWGHLSNNSIVATSGEDYSYLADRIALNGEPGVIWLDIAQRYGRLADPEDGKEYRTRGVNPCGEQPLEHMELCTLVETFPSNCDGMLDYLRTLKFAYLYGKTVTLLMTRWPETNEVMIRNRRIGTSMTGIAQFAETHGWHELRRWQDAGYKEVKKWDRIYSEWLGVRESIRVTTVKPSGTVSLLHGVTPGAHWPKERGYYVRTVREMKDSPVTQAMQEAGYLVEPSVSDPYTTVVIYMPVEGPEVRAERDVSIWEKASLAAQCQRYWSDNSVSVTLTFREDEKDQVEAVLRAFDGQLKSVSFLPAVEGVYKQAPYQRVSKEQWDKMRECVKPIDWEALYNDVDLPDSEGEAYCTTDVCEVPRGALLAVYRRDISVFSGGDSSWKRIQWERLNLLLSGCLISLSSRFCLRKRKMKIYLAGPIDGCTDDEASSWRELVKKRLGDDRCLDPMRRDYRGKEMENISNIVNKDLDDIDNCSVVLANCWRPGWGTPMEIMYSWMTGKPVVAVVPEGKFVSPWILYHAEKIHVSLDDAITYLEAIHG